jgi:hypothetical protein
MNNRKPSNDLALFVPQRRILALMNTPLARLWHGERNLVVNYSFAIQLPAVGLVRTVPLQKWEKVKSPFAESLFLADPGEALHGWVPENEPEFKVVCKDAIGTIGDDSVGKLAQCRPSSL